jgi:hypothetical protein
MKTAKRARNATIGYHQKNRANYINPVRILDARRSNFKEDEEFGSDSSAVQKREIEFLVSFGEKGGSVSGKQVKKWVYDLDKKNCKEKKIELLKEFYLELVKLIRRKKDFGNVNGMLEVGEEPGGGSVAEHAARPPLTPYSFFSIWNFEFRLY